MSLSDAGWPETIAEMFQRAELVQAERDAYGENEHRKLHAAGITIDQLPAVHAFTEYYVEQQVTAALKRVGALRARRR